MAQLPETTQEKHEVKMGGIGVILNPRSRRNLRDPRAAYRMARALGDHGGGAHRPEP